MSTPDQRVFHNVTQRLLRDSCLEDDVFEMDRRRTWALMVAEEQNFPVDQVLASLAIWYERRLPVMRSRSGNQRFT